MLLLETSASLHEIPFESRQVHRVFFGGECGVAPHVFGEWIYRALGLATMLRMVIWETATWPVKVQ